MIANRDGRQRFVVAHHTRLAAGSGQANAQQRSQFRQQPSLDPDRHVSVLDIGGPWAALTARSGARNEAGGGGCGNHPAARRLAHTLCETESVSPTEFIGLLLPP